MPRDDIGERIARLEEAQINMSHTISKFEHTQIKTNEAIEGLVVELKGIRAEMARWKGFAGGVVFIVTALWAFVQIGVRSLWDKVAS